jgi:uncharacterized membrane protein
MKYKTKELFAALIVAISFLLAWFIEPMLPARVASHWNAAGEVNGYTSRFWGAFLVPLISFACLLMFVLIPKIDPKKQNIDRFISFYYNFVIVFLLFMFYVNGLTIYWNLGHVFNFIQWLAPAFAALFYSVGALIGHAEMNWFIGIRTPWTLSSEHVWQETNKLGAKLFKISALLMLLGVLMPKIGIWIILVSILTSSITTVVYSYFSFRAGSKNSTKPSL